MSDRFRIAARSHGPSVAAAARSLEDDVWGHLGFLNATDAHHRHYDRILETFADLQLCLIDDETDELVALANCAPLAWNGAALPSTGWDWLVEEGARDCDVPHNTLGALAISVPPRHRGTGHAQRMIGELKRLCERHGFTSLIAPVRPSRKFQHQSVCMRDYVGWTDESGRCYDPWLRSHLQQGARVQGVCERSMVVVQPVAFWETWAGRRFDRSGAFCVEGGLVPVLIDLERDVGIYEEPNVWVRYDCGGRSALN
jgi:GNAT superfamily N-acetyltransferase